MNDYQRIIDYDFSDTVLDDKLVVKFKLKKTFSEDQFISLFSPKKGERFIIRTPDTKTSIIGIGYEATWLLDSNDFLTSFDNSSVLSGFEELRAQAPHKELLKYAIDLRSMTSGTGSFEMSFDHYDPISGKTAEEVIQSAKAFMEELEEN